MAVEDANPNPKIDGKLTVAQHHLPALEAGEYELTVTQDIHALPRSSLGKPAQETFENKVRFAVRGERFKIDPGDLHSVFPPEEAEGEFVNCLPHIVFSRRTLPWERSPLNNPMHDPTSPEDIPTWLALLLFDEDDIQPSFDLKAKAATVQEFFKGASLGSGMSYFDGLPVDCLDYGETVTDSCMAIDIPLALFRAIAPSVEDLKMLAHSRTVSIHNQELDLSGGGNGLSPEDDFSVVFGNRLPRAGLRCTVHLVSLEGLEEYLPGGSQSTAPIPDGKFIRLVSLKSWSFTAVDREGSSLFVELLKNLNADSRVNTLRLDTMSSSAEDPDAAGTVQTALDMGYVALDHGLRGGGNTVSWYRGPLLPYAKEGTVLTGPITSPDAATRYDPSTGILDISYAAAWQLGRLVALQDKTFSTALYLWKRENEKMLAARIEQKVVADLLPQQPLHETMQILARLLTPEADGETKS
jgi:hypothetical protein